MSKVEARVYMHEHVLRVSARTSRLMSFALAW